MPTGVNHHEMVDVQVGNGAAHRSGSGWPVGSLDLEPEPPTADVKAEGCNSWKIVMSGRIWQEKS